MNYLWYFENFTTLIYYNSEKTMEEYLFTTDEDKKEFLESFYIALNFALYIKDMNIHWSKKSIFKQGSKNSIFDTEMR